MTTQHVSGRLRRPVRMAGCLALAAGAVGLAGAASAGAELAGEEGFAGVLARADIASVEVVDPSAPAVPGGQVVFATPGSAQATLDSLGNSQAFASTPYPGDTVAALPGTFNGVMDGRGIPPLPDYPFIARSNHPTQPAEDEQYGPFGVSARSDSDRSAAEATAGAFAGEPALAAGRASADVRRLPDGSATALARSQVNGFAYGTVLRIGEVASQARVTARAGTEPEKEATLVIGAVTINGTPVELTKDGFRAADQTSPFDVSGLTKQLAAAGVAVEYRPGTETPAGITSASVAITYGQEVPGHAPVRTTVILGHVSASAQSEALAVPVDSTDVGVGPVADGGGLQAPAQPAAPVEGDSLPAAFDSAAGQAASTPPLDGPATGPAGGGLAAAAPRSAPLPATPAASLEDLSAGRFYLLVAAGGALALAGAGLGGRFSVRRPGRRGGAG